MEDQREMEDPIEGRAHGEDVGGGGTPDRFEGQLLELGRQTRHFAPRGPVVVQHLGVRHQEIEAHREDVGRAAAPHRPEPQVRLPELAGPRRSVVVENDRRHVIAAGPRLSDREHVRGGAAPRSSRSALVLLVIGVHPTASGAQATVNASWVT